jgi:hypothetical protein
MVAMVALMRKIIIISNAKLKNMHCVKLSTVVKLKVVGVKLPPLLEIPLPNVNLYSVLCAKLPFEVIA